MIGCSVRNGHTLLPIVLPLLQARLLHSDVWVRETGILALGAIAECQRDMDEHLLHIFPFLLTQLVAPSPEIRRISCWTLSRYSAWAFKLDGGLSDGLLAELVKGLMMRILDRHEQVQEAACSALTSMMGHGQQRLYPFIDFILRNLMHALGLYQSTNLLVLYDTVGTLADAVGGAFNQPGYADLMLPPLLSKWSECDSKHPPPLLECITSVVQALGTG